jgi:hypothetical protein
MGVCDIGCVSPPRSFNNAAVICSPVTPRGRGLEAKVRGITDKIKSACQLTDEALDDLRRKLEALAHPATD